MLRGSLGLLLSYLVSGKEGQQTDHDHLTGTHRSVADLDVVYKSCFHVGGGASEPIPVRAELRFGTCEPVILMWKVVCSSSALLQGELKLNSIFLPCPLLDMQSSLYGGT